MNERIKEFDRYSPYINQKIERGIEENRKGLFSVNVKDKDGNPVKNAVIKVKQVSHEFKFGCSAFLLDQFEDEERNKLYRQKFKSIFNYGIVPLYWDTLEPVQGKPRFEKNCENIYRRPNLDLIREYCNENNIKMKGHCLMYNSFNPDWMPKDRRALRIAVDKRSREIGERYGNDFVDLDVINEMFTVYKNTYGGDAFRNFPICDDKNHAKWCFDIAKKYFPHSTLFWNEGINETFGIKTGEYCGDKSVYYLMLKRHLAEGANIEGIGMQFHDFDNVVTLYNSLRMMDIFETYSEFDLPIHISEVSVPSWSNNPDDEELQAELVRRMYSLWFSQKNIDAVVWWNLVDGTAYGDENKFFAGLLRNNMANKKAFDVLDELINKTWHTELAVKTDDDGNAVFSGFYGNYDISVSGAESITLPFLKENTGYYHLTFNLKQHKIII